MAIDNSVKSMFSQFQKQYETAQADNGMGSLGWWPDAGEHQVFVTGLSCEPGKFRQRNDVELDGFTAQFEYQLLEDPGSPEAPRKFQGAPFTLPGDPSSVTDEKSKMRCEIETRRLKGHIETCLNKVTNDMGSALSEIEEILSDAERSIVVSCKCQYDTRNGKTYRKDFLTKNLSS